LGTINIEGSLTLRLQGDGPLRTSVAWTTGRRIIRRSAHDTEQVAVGEQKSALGAVAADSQNEKRRFVLAQTKAARRLSLSSSRVNLPSSERE